jgi:hypothetical protein
MKEPHSLKRFVAKRVSVAGPLMVLLLAIMLAEACSSTDPTVTLTATSGHVPGGYLLSRNVCNITNIKAEQHLEKCYP